MTRFVVARRLAHAGGISTINNRLAAKTLFLEPTPLLPSTYTPPTSPLARLLQRTRLPMGWGAWHLIKSLEPVCQGTLSGLPAAFGAVMWRLKGYVLSSYTALMEAYTNENRTALFKLAGQSAYQSLDAELQSLRRSSLRAHYSLSNATCVILSCQIEQASKTRKIVRLLARVWGDEVAYLTHAVTGEVVHRGTAGGADAVLAKQPRRVEMDLSLLIDVDNMDGKLNFAKGCPPIKVQLRTVNTPLPVQDGSHTPVPVQSTLSS